MESATLLEPAASAEMRVKMRVDGEPQRLWAERSVRSRMQVLRRARHLLAAHSELLVDALDVNPARTRADSKVAEVLPLLAACRFLEREAARILKPRVLGRRGLPFWLAGVRSAVERVPFGVVLVIGPANYPLFLPGVQVFEALAAGNAAVWKPGRGGFAVAKLFAHLLEQAGLPRGLLRVAEESTEAGIAEMQRRADKVFFTGSAEAGRTVLRAAAETATPVVAELAGCDAVIALPSANRPRVVDALAFGMRLNGSATCMAPRRLIVVGEQPELIDQLSQRFASMQPIPVNETQRARLQALLRQAESSGAAVRGDVRGLAMTPVLVLRGTPQMDVAQADVFAPVLTVIEVADAEAAVAAERLCPFGLTVAIFGEERESRLVGARIDVGVVLINDLIAPTADPRVPFGGRRRSGFGVTRGAEGLLEMTAAKTVLARRGSDRRHYQATGEIHERLFEGAIQFSHGGSLRIRIAGLRMMAAAAKQLKQATDSGERQ